MEKYKKFFFDQENTDKINLIEFAEDILNVAWEESTHFKMLNDRLLELGSIYGAFPIHNKLWQNCLNTSSDLAARLCIISLVQECRGLDAGPLLIHKLKSLGDLKGSEIMNKIVDDEVNHVRIGLKWFKKLVDYEMKNKESSFQANKDKIYCDYFRDICFKYLSSAIVPPFNENLRSQAGIPRDWYEPAIVFEKRI